MFESGIKNTGLDNLIKTGYSALGLSTFLPQDLKKAEHGPSKKIQKL